MQILIKGFSIGFNSKILKDVVQKYGKKGLFTDVNYQNYVPTMQNTMNPKAFKEYADKRFNTKFEQWKYEDEIRIIIDGLANKAITLPSEAYSEIIFGYKITKAHKDEILDICKEKFPHIKHFKASLSKTEFKMDIIPLN